MSSLLRCRFLLLILSFLSVDSVTQDFYWRDYVPDDIPHDAIEGAPGRYIAQVCCNGSMVGTLLPQKKIAVFELYGRHNIESNIRILCSPQPDKFYWEYVDFTKPHIRLMENAVKGGYQENTGVNLFIGKVMHGDEWKIGKVVEVGARYNGLWIWNENKNKGTYMLRFDLLKYNSTKTTYSASTYSANSISGIDVRSET